MCLRFISRGLTYWLGLFLPVLSLPALAAISVTDDSNLPVSLSAPAQRIVSLSPHATELLYAAGAGAFVVGVIEHSDYPPQAARITSVGSSAAADIERIVTLTPDLVVAWGSGSSATQIAKLRSLGIPVFESEPRDFDAIASSMERLAKLAGTDAIGQAAADKFRARLKAIAEKYQHRPTVSVFYQIWSAPLMTLNDAHLVSQALRVCGGKNIFGDQRQLAPTISIEAVLQENPEVILTSGSKQDALAIWHGFLNLTAIARGNLFSVNRDWMNRAGPRILDGTEALCKQLDMARSRRK